MKTLFRLSLFLVLMLFVCSCETDEIHEQVSDSEMFERAGVDNVKNNDPEPVDLENKMQWISYMTAQVLLKSVEAREQFKDGLENSDTTNTLALSDLLSVIDTSFKDEFKAEFLHHYFFDSNAQANNPCDGIGKPNSRPKPPGTIGGTPPGTDIGTYIFDLYVASILNDDCLEFYLPNGFLYPHIAGSTNGPAYIKSTAHPLTNDNFNDGYNHQSSCYVTTITVHKQTLGIIVAVRPIRDDIDCEYDDYVVNDFEDFLD